MDIRSGINICMDSQLERHREESNFMLHVDDSVTHSKHKRANWVLTTSPDASDISSSIQGMRCRLWRSIWANAFSKHCGGHTPRHSLWRGSVCICPSAPLLAATAGQSLLASAGSSPEPYMRYLNTQTHLLESHESHGQWEKLGVNTDYTHTHTHLCSVCLNTNK